MIVLNGESYEVQAGETLVTVLERVGVSPVARGIAVAVDGEVIPRPCWEIFALAEDARVEVLTAMQGG
ncbi:MAG TPA: sulfur carrier protein ThiS [Solirubrobacteraceae bacterium]|jgi:sulfur carrier protein|nr:sulfur carrier protein ThiS [Solirubrobacteraceae bacterium]